MTELCDQALCQKKNRIDGKKHTKKRRATIIYCRYVGINNGATMVNRLSIENDANSFDCDLYRLIARAENLRVKHPSRAKDWMKAIAKLHAARPHVRTMMSAEDKKVTT